MLKFFLKNRRRQKRETCVIRGLMVFNGGLRIAGTVVDMSRGGCRFRPSQPGIFAASEEAMLLLPNTRVDCTIRRRRSGHFHCRFNSDIHQTTLTAWVKGEAEDLGRRLAQSRLRVGE